MIPLPVVGEPFARIAMDIVGPLPRSRAGNHYVLVICDYATRYSEAVPLRSIDAEHVAEELVKLFSRVGIPKEILTDQGTNFTYQLLAKVYRLLHIHALRTSPYHPQTDGLVERFNQILKSMLRKHTTKEGKDWDRLLPYVLFAYREVPQASTGFSPFELLYGQVVRGPLDVLRESWIASEKSSESVVSHVLNMRDKLEKMSAGTGESGDSTDKTEELV
jgi:transposase InsO family protein